MTLTPRPLTTHNQVRLDFGITRLPVPYDSQQSTIITQCRVTETYTILPIPPRGKQTLIPIPRLTPGVGHAVPDFPARPADVPVVAPRHPHRLLQGGLHAAGVCLFGGPLQADEAELAVEDGLENAQGVVDGVFDGHYC